MEIENSSGTLKWTPTIEQTDINKITVVVSDGYTKDEQTFETYTNHLQQLFLMHPKWD